MRMVRSSLAIAFLPTTLAAAQLPASRDSSDLVPRELVLALLNLGPSAGPSELRVGTAPEDVPPELIPPGTTVLGSTTMFDNVVIVLTAPQQPDSAIASIESGLSAAGWTLPPEPRRSVGPGQVFLPAQDAVGSSDRPDLMCRDNEFVSFTGSYRRSGGSIVKVRYNRGGQYSPCKMAETTYRSPYEGAPTPSLRAPVGSMITGGSTASGGSGGFSFGVRLSTRLEPAVVLAHYDRQMRDAGWQSVSADSSKLVAVHHYSKQDDRGTSWDAMLLTVAIPGGTSKDVSLRLARR